NTGFIRRSGRACRGLHGNGGTPLADAEAKPRQVGEVAWDGPAATSERVLLRASGANRALVERNQYVRLPDAAGVRPGFPARALRGPFFHRPGAPTIGGLTAGSSMEAFLLADLEVQGEIVGGRPRDTNSRPAPGSAVFTLSAAEVAGLHGFD